MRCKQYLCYYISLWCWWWDMEEPWAKKFHGCACGIRNEGAFGFHLLLIACLLCLLIGFLPLFWEGGWFMVGDIYIYIYWEILDACLVLRVIFSKCSWWIVWCGRERFGVFATYQKRFGVFSFSIYI